MVNAKRWFDDTGTGQFIDVAIYDFDNLGGAVGDIPLGLIVPAGFVVQFATVYTQTDMTSGGAATVALKLEAADDVLAATAIASVTGATDAVPNWTAANTIVTTAEQELTLTVATAALTAGKFEVRLYGYRPTT